MKTEFQNRVKPWMLDCFGSEISRDTVERNHRFLEEALELVQACGCTQSEAHQLVDYVYGRPWGDKPQEVGGVMVTLAALCLAHDIDMHECGELELARILDPSIMDKIRAKQASKPPHSPLPESPLKAGALDVQVAGDHYKKLKIQPVEYIHANGIGFMEGSAIKYLTRWRDKGGLEDLRKAGHFIEMLIQLEEAPAKD